MSVLYTIECEKLARVLVKFFATVREATGVKNIEVNVDTIREVLDSLQVTFGERFTQTVIDQDTGKLKQFFSCMVNGKRIELLDGYDTKLVDGDAVALFPPVGGG
jgi:molybdopterin synthase sulfur carrier subunit